MFNVTTLEVPKLDVNTRGYKRNKICDALKDEQVSNKWLEVRHFRNEAVELKARDAVLKRITTISE